MIACGTSNIQSSALLTFRWPQDATKLETRDPEAEPAFQMTTTAFSDARSRGGLLP